MTAPTHAVHIVGLRAQMRQSRAFEWLIDRQSLLKSLDAEIVDATAYSLASPSAALVNGEVGSVVR